MIGRNPGILERFDKPSRQTRVPCARRWRRRRRVHWRAAHLANTPRQEMRHGQDCRASSRALLGKFQSEGPRSIARRIPRCSRVPQAPGQVPSLACTRQVHSGLHCVNDRRDFDKLSRQQPSQPRTPDHPPLQAGQDRAGLRAIRQSARRRAEGGYHGLTAASAGSAGSTRASAAMGSGPPRTAAGTGTRWCVRQCGVGLAQIAPWRRKCDLPRAQWQTPVLKDSTRGTPTTYVPPSPRIARMSAQSPGCRLQMPRPRRMDRSVGPMNTPSTKGNARICATDGSAQPLISPIRPTNGLHNRIAGPDEIPHSRYLLLHEVLFASSDSRLYTIVRFRTV